MSDYERFGNHWNLTPEQARNRRERREADSARTRANRLAQENEHLRAALASGASSETAGLDVEDAAVSFIRVFDQQGFDGDRERLTRAIHALRRAARLTPVAGSASEEDPA